MTHIRAYRDDDAMVMVKVLIQNGYTVRIHRTDDTLIETIIEFWREERGKDNVGSTRKKYTESCK